MGQFSSVHLLSHVWLFATPWTAACQASLFITNSQSPPKPMSIESVMPSNHLILCRPLLFLPSIYRKRLNRAKWGGNVVTVYNKKRWTQTLWNARHNLEKCQLGQLSQYTSFILVWHHQLSNLLDVFSSNSLLEMMAN